jgi:hypothetical protein
MDESGTSDVPGNTSHFVLVGLSIPVTSWRLCDGVIDSIKKKYQLSSAEVHTGWMLRPYSEQQKIGNFQNLDYVQRRAKVEQYRVGELLRLQRLQNHKLYEQTKKNFRKTQDYIHLTYDERKAFIKDMAHQISQWNYARLFAECVNKIFFDPTKTNKSIDEQSFEQVVTRFEHYLQIISKGAEQTEYCGLLIHDNNQTVSKRHTELMKNFHQTGTMWTKILNIIETPLFVDSQLTSMIQIADVCSYALRRYLENNEDELFDLVFQRADRHEGDLVGIRHFTDQNCTCKICSSRKKFIVSQPNLPLTIFNK